MVLGTEKLLKLVKTKKLVEGLSGRELETPEGAGFDLRLGEIWEVEGGGFLGVKERETPKLKLVALRRSAPQGKPKIPQIVSLKPGKYYLTKTVESLNLPKTILAIFRPRSTLYRSGIALFSGNASPGYRGEINVGLVNFGPKPFKIAMGARFLHAIFLEVKGKTHLYRGQWQDGRTQTKGREKQT